jgi:GH25 family lysozyme M1 (1,4-beta-N-acetylmuramidase)
MRQKILLMLVLASWYLGPILAHAAFIEGIDVSHWQGTINWNAVKNDGIEFAYAKATEGVDFIDSRYVQNMNNARAAGVLIGPYHFARPDSAENNPLDAANEANDFVDAIEPYYQIPGKFLRPVLDVERLPGAGDIPAGTTQKAFLSEWIRDFIAVVESRLGFAPLIYTNSSYANNYFEPDLAQNDLWIARWTLNPLVTPTPSNLGIWNDWEFWQWTDSWSVAGIAGNVDGNLFEGTIQDLMQFVVGADPTSDFDDDGDSDGADFLVWQRGLGISNDANPSDGDANWDGAVDMDDLTVWHQQLGTVSTVAATLAVPEPTTWLLSFGLLLWVSGRKFENRSRH